MDRGKSFLGVLGCSFLALYILFGLTDPVDIVTVLAGSLRVSSSTVSFVQDMWRVWAEGGIVGFIYWIFTGFDKTISFVSLSGLWDVIVGFFRDNFFMTNPW